MRLELAQVDLNNLVILCTSISLELMRERIGKLGNVATLGRAQIVCHARVVREDGGGGSDLKGRVCALILWGRVMEPQPTSAPMLQMVAMPVHEIESTPGPKYSTMAPVPPLTVSTPATFKMTSGWT